MLLAMARAMRVILIKLADRFTTCARSRGAARQAPRIARETMENLLPPSPIGSG